MICLGALPTVVAFLNPGRGSDGRPWSSSAASSTATVLMRFMDFRCARRDSCCSFSSKLPLLKEARKLKKISNSLARYWARNWQAAGAESMPRRTLRSKQGHHALNQADPAVHAWVGISSVV